MTNELRQAAERALADELCELSERVRPDVELLATHVLATVRADDETTITPAWLESVGFRQAYKVGTHEILDVAGRFAVDANYGDTWLNQGRLVHIRTRGQLRHLCSALSIELREAP